MPKTKPKSSQGAGYRIFLGTVGFLGAALVWQLSASTIFSNSFVPELSETLAALLNLTATVDFWLNVLSTAAMAVIGFAIAVVVGTFLGVMTGLYETLYQATHILFEFIKPIPPIVILPLALIIFGPSIEMGVALSILGCVMPVVVQTQAGIRSVDQVTIETGRSFGMPPTEVLGKIILPSLTPYVGTAIRTSAPTALIVAVVAGLVGGAPGLGRSLMLAQGASNYDVMFAILLVLGVMGVVVLLSVSAVERKVLHWDESQRNKEFA